MWAIHTLTMHSVGSDTAMPFQALLKNAIPPGDIAITRGSFGPWHAKQPGQTPLSGDFTFARADLGVFKGISGVLSAKGTFDGLLHRIKIHGETTVPEFALVSAGNPVPLHAKYDATVDGTNGDTFLGSGLMRRSSTHRSRQKAECSIHRAERGGRFDWMSR